MKRAADDKAYVKPSTIKEGDAVIIKPPMRRRKIDPVYDPRPYHVTHVKGSMVTAQRGTHRVTRNSSFFKHVTSDVVESEDESSWDDDISTGDIGDAEDQQILPDDVDEMPRYPARMRNRPRHLDDYDVY